MPKAEKVKVNVKDRVEDNTIDLSLSELQEVPVKEIASFKRVTILDLSNNKIISLGKNFSILTHITKLDLSKNQLKYLPEDFGALKNLRHLDLYNNRLEHLPLSFGNLNNLRYLDLKTNPLTPALAKIVGPCLTTKDCSESAKNTVKFLAKMQVELERAKEKLQEEADEAQIEQVEDKKSESQKPKKNPKKGKSKSKKSSPKSGSSSPKQNNVAVLNNSNSKSPKSAQHAGLANEPKTNTALRTVFIFFFLLVINIVMIYVITVRNPEIGEKIVGLIPVQYQELVHTKIESFRSKVSVLIEQFRTPPDHSN